MSWFQNFKIAKKLIATFLGVALIAGIVGAVGIVGLYNLAQEDTLLFEYYTLPLEQMGNVTEAYQRSRVYFREALLTKDPKIQEKLAKLLSKDNGGVTLTLGESGTKKARAILSSRSTARSKSLPIPIALYV